MKYKRGWLKKQLDIAKEAIDALPPWMRVEEPMSVDNFVDRICQNSLSKEEIKQILAEYAIDCLHDKALAQEAFEIIKKEKN